MILLKVSKSKHVQISLLLYLVVNSFLPNVLILYPPLPKNLYKNCTKWIPKLYKTLNLYIFCIQRSYKSKLCMIMNVQEIYIKFLHIYKKNIQTTKLVQSSDQKRLQTWNVFCTNSTKPIQFKQQPETAFVCFLYTETMHKLYKTYTNVNWIIYSATDVCFLYMQRPHILYFWNLHQQ